MDDKYNEVDGFSLGERIDMDLAKGARLFVLSFPDGEKGKESPLCFSNAESGEYVDYLYRIYHNDPERVRQIIRRMGYIADTVRDKLEKLGSNLNYNSPEGPSDKDKEMQVDMFRRLLEGSGGIYGFFFMGSTDPISVEVGTGFHGTIDQVSRVLVEWFVKNPRSGAELISLLHRVVRQSKANVARHGKLDERLIKWMEDGPLKKLNLNFEDFIKYMKDAGKDQP
jgi:hypothetical protein